MKKEGLVIVGIDPAFRTDGFSVAYLSVEKKTIHFQTYSHILDFFDYLRSEDFPKNPYFIIENSNETSALYKLVGIVKGMLKGYMGRGNKGFSPKYTEAQVISVAKRIGKYGTGVGKNQAVSQIVVDLCSRLFSPKVVRSITPKNKGAKIENTAEFLALLRAEDLKFGSKRTNQDQRDAAVMALKYKEYLKLEDL